MNSISRFVETLQLCSSLALLILTPVLSRADPILSLPTSGDLSPDIWKPADHPNVSMKDGVLHIVSSGDKPGQYNINYIFNANPLAGLNFLHNSVEIKLENLDVKGDADPSKQVFCLFLINDAPLESPQSSLLKMRFSPDGTLSIAVIAPGSTPRQLWQGPVKFPIKTMTISLDAKGAKFSLEDASGPKSQQASWTDAASMSSWDSSAPFLRLQGQRAPGTGSSEVTLGAFTVNSTPATSTP